MGDSTTCMVVPPDARPWWEEPDLEYRSCGKPVIGSRGDWPMCEEHYALFDPTDDRLRRAGGVMGNRRLPRRHPADVTADRLGQHYEDWYDRFDGRELDDISHVIFLLREVAEGNK